MACGCPPQPCLSTTLLHIHGWHCEQTICGLSMTCCSAVPVAAAEFDWMTLGAPPSPAALCFCWKLVPSDCLFIGILGRCVRSCSCLLLREFSPGYALPSCRGFSCVPGLWQHLLLVVSVLSTDCLLELGYETD